MINSKDETTQGSQLSTPLRWSAVVAAVAYAALRIYWAAGGRLGFTWCVPGGTDDPAAVTAGCPPAGGVAIPWIDGWPAVAGSGLIVVLASAVAVSPRLRFAALTAPAAVALIALAFPGHLLFEVPAAVAGWPTDLRDLAHRTLILTVGLILGSAAWSRRPRGGREEVSEPRRPPRWAQGAAYASAAIAVLGFTAPHLLWFAGVPMGIDTSLLTDIRTGITRGVAIALCAGPVAGGLVTLGLAHQWGQQVPRRLPLLGGRRVPRMAAIIPATVISIALISYGLLGLGIVGRELRSGTLNWSGLVQNWAVTGTEVVFLLWGLTLGVATVGYARTTGVLPTGPQEEKPALTA